MAELEKLRLTDEQVAELVRSATEDIKKRAVDYAVQQLGHMIQYTVANTIEAQVAEFIKTEVTPDIKQALMLNKSVLVEAAVSSAQEMATKLRQAMLNRLEEKLKQSYKRDQIFKELFGA